MKSIIQTAIEKQKAKLQEVEKEIEKLRPQDAIYVPLLSSTELHRLHHLKGERSVLMEIITELESMVEKERELVRKAYMDGRLKEDSLVRATEGTEYCNQLYQTQKVEQ